MSSEPYDIFKAIEDVLGREAASVFRAAVAGQRLTIPKIKFIADDSLLAKSVGGIDRANVLLAELKTRGLTNMNVTFPMLEKSLIYENGLLIDKEILKGEKSALQIAAEFRVTERCVYKRRAKLVAAGIEVGVRKGKKNRSATLALSDLEMDIATSPILNDAVISEIAANYGCTINHVMVRIRRLRFRGFVTSSNSRDTETEVS